MLGVFLSYCLLAINMHIAVDWSAEFMPSDSNTELDSPRDQRGGPDILSPYIQGGLPLCSCLVFRSIVSGSSYSCLTHGNLGCNSLGV